MPDRTGGAGVGGEGNGTSATGWFSGTDLSGLKLFQNLNTKDGPILSREWSPNFTKPVNHLEGISPSVDTNLDSVG